MVQEVQEVHRLFYTCDMLQLRDANGVGRRDDDVRRGEKGRKQGGTRRTINRAGSGSKVVLLLLKVDGLWVVLLSSPPPERERERDKGCEDGGPVCCSFIFLFILFLTSALMLKTSTMVN